MVDGSYIHLARMKIVVQRGGRVGKGMMLYTRSCGRSMHVTCIMYLV